MAARKPFQTDALNASSIPTASLGRLRRHGANLIQTDESDLKGELGERHQRQLDKVHEEWNARIDRELKGVVGCLKDLVELSDISSNPAPHNHTTQALHLKLRTSQLIRSTQTIRDMAHELKMTLLLSDQVSDVIKRDGEMRLVRRDIEERRGQVGEELVALLGGGGGGEDSKTAQQEQRKDGPQPTAPDSVPVANEPARPSIPGPSQQTDIQAQSPKPSAIVVDSSSSKNGGDGGNGGEDEDDEDEEMEEV